MSRLKDRFFQNACKPRGFLGRLMMIRMNFRHRKLHRWGMALLLKQVPEGTVEGIDYSEDAVVFARRRNKSAGNRCLVNRGDVGALPFRENSFDIVTAFETVYFWPDLKRSLNGIYRVLKPGGRFLLCCETDCPTSPGNSVRIRGMRIYTADALSDFSEAAGFTDISVYRHPAGWFCLYAKK